MTVKAVVEIDKPEDELFWVMPVTFDPMPPLINTLPVPVPLLVIVPVLLTASVEIVMPLAKVLLFLKVRLPVPVMPPEWVKRFAPLFASVSPPTPSVVAPAIVTRPSAAGPLVTVTALAPWVIEPLRPKVLPLIISSVRLLFRAIEPVKLTFCVPPKIDSVPVVPSRTMILFAWLPSKVDASVALLLPVVSPSVIVPVPNAAATVPLAVPLLIVTPPVKVLAPPSEALPVKAVPPDTPRVNPPAPAPQTPVWEKFPLPVSVAV